ncbi:hypothetical protein D3C81_1022590 [compost metagenome]
MARIFCFLQGYNRALVEVEQYLAQLPAHLLIVSGGILHRGHARVRVHRRQVQRLRHAGTVALDTGQGLARFRGGAREFLQLLQSLRDGVQLAIRLRAELLELLFGQAGRDGDLRVHVGMYLAQGNSLLVSKPFGRQGDVFQFAHALLILLHGEVGQGTHGQQASQRDHRDDQHLLCDFH